MHYVFIYNPNAGMRSDPRIKPYLERLVSEPACDTIHFMATEKKGDPEVYARQVAKRYGKDAVVIAVGGDGTLSEIANGLVGSDTPLLVLPTGRGNDFSRSIYVDSERDPIKILDALNIVCDEDRSDYATVYDIDLLHVEATDVSYPTSDLKETLLTRYCINALSIGFDSNAVIASDRLSRKLSFLGNSIYYVGALLASFRKMKFRFDFRIDEERYENRAYSLLAICNARFYGSGFQPNPKGRLADGYLEATISTPVNLWHVLLMARKYKAGRIEELDIVELYRGREVELLAGEGDKLIVTIDGNPFYCKHLTVRNEQAKLKLMVPRSLTVADALK